MKITKSKLRKIIKEEVAKIKEIYGPAGSWLNHGDAVAKLVGWGVDVTDQAFLAVWDKHAEDPEDPVRGKIHINHVKRFAGIKPDQADEEGRIDALAGAEFEDMAYGEYD
jgi:hypothetical protein